MLCSELIDKLSKFCKEHGDRPVWIGEELDYHSVEDVGVVRKNTRGQFSENKKFPADHFYIS